MTRKLSRSFFDRPTLEICPELIGKIIVFKTHDSLFSARIVEVEAYVGQADPACHAARGMTERNQIMFGPPGMAYIYFIYGMYNCLNFVTEADGIAAAILLRGAEPIDGIEAMRQRSKAGHDWQLLNGPGKFCRSFGLTREQNGLDLTGRELYLEQSDQPPPVIERSPRIGIRAGTELIWRFFDPASRAVSRVSDRNKKKKEEKTKEGN